MERDGRGVKEVCENQHTYQFLHVLPHKEMHYALPYSDPFLVLL